MIIDGELVLSEDQVVTASAGSTKVYDMQKAGDAVGKELYLHVRCTADCTTGGSTTVAVALRTSATLSGDALESPITVVTTAATAAASIDAGMDVLVVKLPPGLKRYIDVGYVVVGDNLATGKFTAFLNHDLQQAY